MFRKMFLGALGLLMVLAAGTVILNGCSEKKGGSVMGPNVPNFERPAIAPVLDGEKGQGDQGDQILPGTPPSQYPDAPPIPGIPRGGAGGIAADVMGVPSWRILQETYSWLGVPYVYGGNSRSGIDCSHLVYQVYRNVGINCPYLTTSQMRTSGRFICVNPVPGDIIVFRYLNHCGIYIGNGWMVDANSYYLYNVVRYDYIWDPYWIQQGPYAIRFVG